MKNILSIDFDIIMAPTIESYNDRVPFVPWDRLQRQPFYHTCHADLRIYQDLTNYLISLMPYLKAENIHFIEDHDSIIDFLSADDYYNIHHIDFHHDMGYEPPEALKEKEEELGCANWVKFIPNLFSCTWIHTSNSSFPPNQKLFSHCYEASIEGKNFSELIPSKPHEVFICLSPPWIPPMIRPLYHLWIDMFNKYYNTEFKIYTNKNKQKEEVK